MKLVKPLHPYLLSATLLSKFESSGNVHDVVEVDDDDNPNDGWTRLKKMYSLGKTGLASPQIAVISEGGFTGFLAGFIMGSMRASRDTYLKFIEENKATMYKNPFEAKRALQDTLILSAVKGGWKVGWRIGLFTASLLTILVSINTYRGRSSIMEFTLAGAATGGLFKFKQGPKPCVAGAAVGGGYGTLAGIVIVGYMKLTGATFEELYSYEYDRIEKHQTNKMEYFEKKRPKDFLDIPYQKKASLGEAEFPEEDDQEKSNVEDSDVQKANLGDAEFPEEDVQEESNVEDSDVQNS